MPDIHPSSIVHPEAKLAPDVVVGPFCSVGKDVTLGAGCVLQSHVVVEGPSTFGERNTFFPFSVIGLKSQDLKYTGEPTFLEVGSDNVFRENSTINRGTMPGCKTIIGSHNHFLVSSHVGHDCIVGDHVILSGFAGAAGHVQIGDYAILSGFAAIHQFVRIGCHSIIAGVARVVKDVPPYMIAEGHPAHTRAVNQVGLSRRGFSEEDMHALRNAYKKLFLKKGTNVQDAINELLSDESTANNKHVRYLIDFINTSERGIC